MNWETWPEYLARRTGEIWRATVCRFRGHNPERKMSATICARCRKQLEYHPRQPLIAVSHAVRIEQWKVKPPPQPPKT